MKTLAVCATYGRLPYLGRMLSSFIHQSYDDKHLVIINDDTNIQLCCNHKNVTILNCNKKLLVSEKRNLGIASGYHDLIFPWDDDDVYLPQVMSNHLEKYNDNSIGAFRNTKAYIIYGDKFIIDRSSDNFVSFLKKSWFEVGGYYNPVIQGEDIEINEKFRKRDMILEIEDIDNMDSIYNFGGVNYHLSGSIDHLKSIDRIAYDQLVSMNLVGKKFWIEPDFEQYNNFLMLESLWKKNKQEMIVNHIGPAKIALNV